MSITQAICTSFKSGIFIGTHDLSADALKIALYDRSTSSIGPETTAYTDDGEITGAGYTAGGKTISVSSGYPAANPTNTTQIDIRFDTVSWTSAAFSAGSALIYNSDKSNAAIVVLDFGLNYSVSNGTFSITFPTTSPATIILR